MAHIDTAIEARPPRRKRPKKPPRYAYDRRFRIGRRVVELVDAFTAKLGQGLVAADPLLAAAVERAARLVAYSEALQAKALRGDPDTSPDDLVRCSRLADQAVRRLHLDRDRKADPDGLSLAGMLRGTGR